jgi:hypothetical protein
MACRSLVVMLVLVGGAARARADEALDTRDARNDHRGALASGALFAGSLDSDGLAIGAEGSLGWGVTPWLALLSRGAVEVWGDREGATHLQLGARAWPFPTEMPWVSVEAFGGRASVGEEYDCYPSTTVQQCWGGHAIGYSGGGAMHIALGRGRHGSFDLSIRHEIVRWHDATNDTPDDIAVSTLALGFSLY